MLARTFSALLLTCAGSAYVAAEDSPSPELTDAEFAELTRTLDETQDALLGLISGLSDEQWTFKQNPDRWSVAECTEHIVRSQRALLETIKRIVAQTPDPEWATRTAGKTDIVRQLVPMRGPQGQGGRQAPDEIRPTEHWDRARAFQELYAAQGEVRAYVETMDRRIKDRTQESQVPQFGWMNAYDWLNVLAMHTVRHSRQIVEVQEDPNYPKRGTAAGAP